jgi:hypothetical protein
MAKKTYRLTASVSAENPQAIKRDLDELFEEGAITSTKDSS